MREQAITKFINNLDSWRDRSKFHLWVKPLKKNQKKKNGYKTKKILIFAFQSDIFTKKKKMNETKHKYNNNHKLLIDLLTIRKIYQKWVDLWLSPIMFDKVKEIIHFIFFSCI